MGQFIKTQNSFANGEVSSTFYACDGIKGLSKLENMDVLPGGGLSRRDGLTSVALLDGAVRLISFSASGNQEYLLALGNYHMYIFYQDKLVQDLLTPWAYSDVVNLQYAQRLNTMIFVHPDYEPSVLKKNKLRFDLSDFMFAHNDSNLDSYIPFVRFDDSIDISITVATHSLGNNFATFTTDKDFWTSDNVGGRFILLGRQWNITEYISPTKVVAHTNGTYTLPSAPVTGWQEAAFSKRRGWPGCITFHQDRLVFGGSRDWPSGIWMSKVAVHNNFDSGTGLDDEAIFINLLSDKHQHICSIVSSENLQILTTSGEWAISCNPLTPSSVDVKQHTSIGSFSNRYLSPQKIEGSTIFVSKNGRDIRELCLDDLGEKYNSNDLCTMSKHLIQDPVDMAYNLDCRRLYVVCASGDMAVLNHDSSLGLSAWSRYKTAGKFLSVAITGNSTYVAVERGASVFLERFDSGALCDAGTYSFSYFASALPLRASGHNARRLRLNKICARVLNTKSVFINGHRIALANHIYDKDSDGYTGDVSIGLLGTHRECISAPWTIHGEESQPITVLSVTMYGTYTV